MNILKYLLIAFFFSLSISSSFAAESMRRCLLLPIKDHVGGALGFQVFQDVEKYLKNSNWCYYRSNSDILDILGNYRKNLDTHLKNKDVLQILADKTRSGSLIRIEIENAVAGGVIISMAIIGGNGEDIYYKDKKQLENDDTLLMAQMAKNWLDIYEKTIPYDGRVVGVLGDQFTIDMGKAYGFYKGSELEVIRAVGKKRHPLLQEVVDWKTEKIGEGKIFHVTKVQSQGRMLNYISRKRLQLGDWVVMSEKSKNQIDSKSVANYGTEKNSYSFGRIGSVSVFADVGSASTTLVTTSGTRKTGGLLFGVDVDLEIWATRKFWGSIEFGKKFGSFSKEEGTFQTASNTIDTGRTKIKAGYRYLPLGFFYGPRVDGFIGYANYSYSLENQLADGLVGTSFDGVLIGVKGSMPIMKDLRLHIGLDFIFSPGYTEDVVLYGEDDSASNFHLEIGGQYKFNRKISLELAFDYISNKASFVAPNRQANFKESTLKSGVTFNF